MLGGYFHTLLAHGHFNGRFGIVIRYVIKMNGVSLVAHD